MENYLIVLFVNKVKKKIIKKYKTYKQAKKFFDKQIENNSNVIFEKKIINGHECNLELSLIELSSNHLLPVYVTDEMGRNVKVKLEDSNMTIVEIKNFKEEEEIYDYQLKIKLNSRELIMKYLKSQSIKMISSLNNKVIIQNEEKIYLFSLKNEEESKRFLDCLSLYFFKIRRSDCIFVKDVSSPQKKYLYSLLENYGFDKKILYRKFTTFPLSK